MTLHIGLWKAPADRPSAVGYCDPSRGQDLFSSPKFSSGTNSSSISHCDNDSFHLPTSKSMFWSEGAIESISPVVSKGTVEKRPGNGYRLFGIDLVDPSTVEDTPMIVSGAVVDDLSLTLQVESDLHSEPYDADQSDLPSVSCKPEKSSLQPQHELHSRHIRSCTKVVSIWFLNIDHLESSRVLIYVVVCKF